MPTIRRSAGAVVRRVIAECEILRALAESPCGLSLGQLREVVQDNLEHLLALLIARHQVQRFDGVIFGITDLGRSRLTPTPPVCVIS